MTVRYGIIGSGMMGHEHIRNLQLLKGAEVVAVADPDIAMRDSARNLAGSQCAAFDDHRRMIDAGVCDALVVAAPNHTHHAILKDVLATALPVLVEKPLCIDLGQCREVAELAGRRKTPVWVAMEYRYMPPVQELLSVLRRGEAGQLRMLAIREHRFPFLKKVGDWNRFNENTGGTLVEKCCHFWDLMRLLAKSEPVRVYASGAMDVNFLDERYAGRRPDILDNAFVTVEFANGVRGMLDLCMFAEGSYWQESISATGDKARVDALIPGPARFAPGGKERHSEIVISPRATKVEVRRPVEVDASILAAGDHHGSTFFQHRKFFDMVVGGGEPEVDVSDGLIAVAVGAAAEESVRTGQAIKLPNLGGRYA